MAADKKLGHDGCALLGMLQINVFFAIRGVTYIFGSYFASIFYNLKTFTFERS